MWEPQGMYSKFALQQPIILFGENAIMGLKTFPSSRVAIIHGTSLKDDYKNNIKKSLSSFEISFMEKSWKGEPSLITLSDSIKEIQKIKPDTIIAIGGGSVIDGAKMIRTYYEFPFFDTNDTRFSLLNWTTNFVVIPTTIGSGAEISSASVMFNEKNKTKEFIICHKFIPQIVVLESNLIENAPKKLLLSSIIDAISHCIEGYMSNIDNIIIDVYAEKAIQIISKNYKFLINNNIDNKEYLTQLQLASFFAGMVQNHCIVGAAHSLAHQMSDFGLSHSDAISIFLPSVIRKNIKNNKALSRFEKLASNSGFDNSFELIEFVDEIISSFDLTKERELLLRNKNKIISDNDLLERALIDKGGKGNPIPLDKKFLEDIINKSII
tara:strand:+ start:9578 stop:10720 length:1143 start_codon:yes stop_codon:yes gene_type:complete